MFSHFFWCLGWSDVFGLQKNHCSATNSYQIIASDLSPRRLSDLEASGLLDQCIRPWGGLLWPVVACCGSFLLLHNEENTKIKL